MNVKRDARATLPPGLSTEAEARWWDEHPEYWDDSPGAEVVVGPAAVKRTRQVNLRLPVVMIDALKQEADKRSLPDQTLIRMWLKERLG